MSAKWMKKKKKVTRCELATTLQRTPEAQTAEDVGHHVLRYQTQWPVSLRAPQDGTQRTAEFVE